MCSLWCDWQYVIIGSDNGLAPNRRQVIIWTDDGLVYWCIYASLGLNEFTQWLVRHLEVILQVYFSNSFYKLNS